MRWQSGFGTKTITKIKRITRVQVHGRIIPITSQDLYIAIEKNKNKYSYNDLGFLLALGLVIIILKLTKYITKN